MCRKAARGARGSLGARYLPVWERLGGSPHLDERTREVQTGRSGIVHFSGHAAVGGGTAGAPAWLTGARREPSAGG